MYLISTLGWNEDNFNAITNGIVKAIQQAYEMLNQGTTAKLLVNSGILLNTNIKYDISLPVGYSLLNPNTAALLLHIKPTLPVKRRNISGIQIKKWFF